jgi:hypothetical protein
MIVMITSLELKTIDVSTITSEDIQQVILSHYTS